MAREYKLVDVTGDQMSVLWEETGETIIYQVPRNPAGVAFSDAALDRWLAHRHDSDVAPRLRPGRSDTAIRAQRDRSETRTADPA